MRRETLDGDGYDDLAIWGNEGLAGINPRLYVFFGGETLENPDRPIDLTIPDPPDEPAMAAAPPRGGGRSFHPDEPWIFDVPVDSTS